MSKQIVYLPGVWDLLHAGHLNVIRRAKLCGDYLIVGVCCDALVSETKRDPVMNDKERAELISSLKYVDEVFIYSNLDQSQVLEIFNVDTFCFGDDYGGYEEHKRTLNFCKVNHIQVKMLHRYQGVSSTQIKRRISMPSMGNIGVDFHDTISYCPEFFRSLLEKWNGDRFIVTGTKPSRRREVEEACSNLGLKKNVHYDNILFGFEYDDQGMKGRDHYKKMREHKYKCVLEHNIQYFFDDNPFYVDYLRNMGVFVFQTILSDTYVEEYRKKSSLFSCHLQQEQFSFLSLQD